MRGHWPVIFGAIVMVCVAAEPVFSAPQPGRAVETETIIIPPDSLELGEPGLTDPEIQGPDAGAPESELFDAGPTVAEPANADDLPEVLYDTSKLPLPVRRLRDQIVEAATTGDIENLRAIFDANGEPPAISFNEDGDPIEQLLSLSGDPEGREVLAILIEVLDAGFVHVDAGTPDEMYVWPYFARYPLDALTGSQMVELFKLLTAGDYEDMKIYGTYLFYRVGIAPNGVWRYFLAGD